MRYNSGVCPLSFLVGYDVRPNVSACVSTREGGVGGGVITFSRLGMLAHDARRCSR